MKGEKMKEIKMNIRHHLMLALGTKELIWDYIDKVYEANKFEYYQAYIQGGFPDDVAKTRFSAQVEERIIKVMAINTWCEFNKDYTIIHDFVKKGYKRAWNYFKKCRNSDVVILDTFIKEQIEKQGVDNVNESEIYNNIFVLLFLCNEYNVAFGAGNVNAMLEAYFDAFQENLFARELRENSIENIRDNAQWKEYLNKSYEHMSVTDKFFKEDKTVGLLLDKIIMEDEIKLYKQQYGAPLLVNGVMRISSEEYYEFRHRVFKYSYSKFIGSYSQVIKMFGLSEEIFERVSINKKEMDFLLYHLKVSEEYNELTEKDREGFMIGMLYIYALCVLYKDLKKHYLEDAKDEEYKELVKSREALREKQETLDSMLLQQKQKEKETADMLYALQEENKKLKAEAKALNSELQTKEDNTKELIALREFAYNQENTEHSVGSEVPMDKVGFINSKKVAVFGGHPIWHSKLKELFPNMVLVAPEKVGLDFSFVENFDAVFVHSSYCNHSMYKKLMNVVKMSKCSLGYTSTVNMNLTINEMYNTLKG